MKHLGDITKIDGWKIPYVDVITGGSPCQDLSQAGKRAGLEGERSGLFMEQIRVLKEMRLHAEADRRAGAPVPGCPGRFLVWENVYGALTSNNGKDFARVLGEIVRIKVEEAPDPPVPQGGWPTAGIIVGDGYSIAYRLHDAQFWGVPQRRRRIALVADLDGLSATKIAFECDTGTRRRSEVLPLGEGLSRNSDEGSQAGKGTAGRTQGSTADKGGDDLGGIPEVLRRYAEVRKTPKNWDGTDTCFTLTSNNANGAQRMPDKENLSCVLDVRNFLIHDEYWESEETP